MVPENVNQGIELIARSLEVIGVAVIALAFAYAMLRGLLHVGQKRVDAYERLKVFIGKALLLGLEFMVAADIIGTITVKPTLEGLEALGMLIGIRIVLGWSIAVEIEGCWPWRVKESRKARKEGDRPDR